MKTLNLFCCTSSSDVAVVPQESTTKLKPSTTINASHSIDYQNAGLVDRAYMGRPSPKERLVPIKYSNGSAYLERDINCLYIKDGKLWER